MTNIIYTCSSCSYTVTGDPHLQITNGPIDKDDGQPMIGSVAIFSAITGMRTVTSHVKENRYYKIEKTSTYEFREVPFDPVTMVAHKCLKNTPSESPEGKESLHKK